MSLLKPSDDFLLRSVRTVRGKVSRLAYIAKLRSGKHDYQHWGMERTYGKDVARSAISNAHSTVWHELLGTRIQDLESDSLGETENDEFSKYHSDDSLIPYDTGAGTKRHFVFLMKTVKLLLRHRR